MKKSVKVGLIAILVLGGVGTLITLGLTGNLSPKEEYQLVITTLENAGAMIEGDGKRIYIDPIKLDESFGKLPADIIFLTHHHSDHYSALSIDLIRTDDTLFVGPAGSASFCNKYDALVMEPHQNATVGGVYFETLPMYTFEDPYYFHEPEDNWCGYVIEIAGFRIFHGGDSDFIPEYEAYTGEVDIALVPITGSTLWGRYDDEIDIVTALEPEYVMTIHCPDATRIENFQTACNELYPDLPVYGPKSTLIIPFADS